MIVTLLYFALLGNAWVILLDKWRLDERMRTHPFWSKYAPSDPCDLCRMFWFATIFYVISLYVPQATKILFPLVLIPAQQILRNLNNRLK